MAKPVELTEIAEQDLEQITDCLIETWGIDVCNKFITHFEKVSNVISGSPRMYRMINKRARVRMCILTKQNTIYFRERRQKIEILTIFDSRQNPDKLREILSKSLK